MPRLQTLIFFIGLLIFSQSHAGVPAQCGDYVFRGISQTDNDLAIQGGIDYKQGHAYAGIWASNVELPIIGPTKHGPTDASQVAIAPPINVQLST